MKQIQEHNNSIYYIQNNELVEFNIITKRKRIRCIAYEPILEYHILSSNLIGYLIGNKYYLNYMLLLKDQEKIFVLQKCAKYILGRKDNYLCFYDLSGMFVSRISQQFRFIQFDVADNSQIITWGGNGSSWGDIKIYSLDNNLRLNFTKILFNEPISHTIYVRNSSRLAVIKNSLNFGKFHLINTNNKNIAKVIKMWRTCDFFDTNRDIMVCLECNIVELYDVYKLNLITQIRHDYNFVYYHKKLDLLITRSLELFVITNDYKLMQLNIGLNYIVDRIAFPNVVMEIISLQQLLFELLPFEIIFVELYQMLLK